MQHWTADGWGGIGYVWTADGAPNRHHPWTADGWLGHFGFNGVMYGWRN
jgi:hypothetical protein